MPDTLPEFALCDLTAWCIKEAHAQANADASAVDDETWETAYCMHLAEARRVWGLDN